MPGTPVQSPPFVSVKVTLSPLVVVVPSTVIGIRGTSCRYLPSDMMVSVSVPWGVFALTNEPTGRAADEVGVDVAEGLGALDEHP